MMFVYPLFLWAFAAVAIPIIIHLFNFRKYTKVYFTNVKFLKELKQESKSKSRLKELLILITRCLAIISLVLAFSQPILLSSGKNINKGSVAASIYIDNSFSMENVNKQGPLLEIAKARAKEVVKVFNTSDKIQIITNDFEGKHQRFNGKEDAINAIDEIKISSSVRSLSDVVKRQNDFLKTSNLSNKKSYLFSDLQKSTFTIEDLKSDTLIDATIIPLVGNQINNVFIDTCWFETPLQQKGFVQKLHAKVVNTGNTSLDVGSAKLILNKEQIAIASFSVEANSSTEIKFTFECKKEGFNYGTIKIEDYPITFDDELFFTFNSKINISVLLVNGNGLKPLNPLNSLFKNDSLFNLFTCTEQAIDYNFFKTSNVIILNQISELSSGLVSELIKYTLQGGAIVLIPSLKSNVDAYNQSLTQLNLPSLLALDSNNLKIDKLETASRFYSGVFEKMEDRLNLPLVTKHYKLKIGTKVDFESILVLQNSDDFFGVTKLNNALLYLFSVPFDDASTNFSKHALFVPTFYQICFKSLKSSPLFYPASSNVIINLKGDPGLGEKPPHIKQINKEFDFIPETRRINNAIFMYTQHQISNAGYYDVLAGDSVLLPLAFNFSRMESNLACYTVDELSKIITDKGLRSIKLLEYNNSDISSQILFGNEGKKLWKLFIILALLFVTTEMILLRLLK